MTFTQQYQSQYGTLPVRCNALSNTLRRLIYPQRIISTFDYSTSYIALHAPMASY